MPVTQVSPPGLAALEQPCWNLRSSRAYGDKAAHLPRQGPPLTNPSKADLLADVGAEGHVGVQLAVVEQVCLLQLSPQDTAFHQVDVRDVGHVPDAAE